VNTYVCTPRGFVFEIFPYTETAEYWDEPDGVRREHRNECCLTAEVSARIRRNVNTLPQRKAWDIYEARIDFAFDQAQRDVLADIKRMFRNAMSDREALARRAARRR
jgi:hypothetical protein